MDRVAAVALFALAACGGASPGQIDGPSLVVADDAGAVTHEAQHVVDDAGDPPDADAQAVQVDTEASSTTPEAAAPPLSCSQTCDGCCDSHDVCQPGTSDNYCGAGGVTCGACAANEVCNGNCQASAPPPVEAGAPEAAAAPCPTIACESFNPNTGITTGFYCNPTVAGVDGYEMTCATPTCLHFSSGEAECACATPGPGSVCNGN